MEEKAVVKIFGERNTASNYLELLVNENIPCEIIKSNLPNALKSVIKLIRAVDKPLLNLRLDEHIRDFLYLYVLTGRLGWKHRMLPVSPSECGLPNNVYYLLTVRDPYAWLSSLYKRPHNLSINPDEITFSQFLRSPCRTLRRELAPANFYETPIEMWNQKTRATLSFSEFRKSSLFRHEDIVLYPADELDRLARELGVGFKNETAVIPNESTKKDGRTKADMERYINEKKWMTGYLQEDIDFVEQRLDRNICSRLNY